VITVVFATVAPILTTAVNQTIVVRRKYIKGYRRKIAKKIYNVF
jgi:hypothetical protein